MTPPETLSPIACDLNAIAAPERTAHALNARQIFDMTTLVRELFNGYALRLPNDSTMLLGVAKFIDHERECCPFFDFALEVEAEHGQLWLKLTGREGVKEFLSGELLNLP
jgi:hypothetical protein